MILDIFDKGRKYSYADQKHQQHQIRWGLLCFLVMYVGYTVLTTFVFSTRSLKSDAMQPALRAGDRFIVSSYSLFSLLPDIPLRRGSVVLVDMDLRQKRSDVDYVLDWGVRFLTAQRRGLFPREHLYVKRIIGLPGDEITMSNYVFRVKPRGESYTYTEFEMTDPYDVSLPRQVPSLWDESIPFSGNMDTIVLGDDECFLLSDDRSNTNDSRTWGPVSLNLIVGKVFFRYWPITRIGLP
jgi:signal peptidase I